MDNLECLTLLTSSTAPIIPKPFSHLSEVFLSYFFPIHTIFCFINTHKSSLPSWLLFLSRLKILSQFIAIKYWLKRRDRACPVPTLIALYRCNP